MKTLSTEEFNTFELSTERESESVYFVRLTKSDEKGFTHFLKYDLEKEKVLESDVKFTEDQLDILHDEVAEQYANDLSEERSYEPNPYRRYGLSEESFI